jgi:hypothetical protein
MEHRGNGRQPIPASADPLAEPLDLPPLRSSPWFLSKLPAPHYLLYCRGFAIASAFRLTLPDALQASWLVPAGLHWLGAALLAYNGCFLGWVMCAVGSATPLLLLQDQLSQSTYLCFCALAALLFFCGKREQRVARLETNFIATVRGLTVLLYVLAAVHKLNHSYLNPAVSCANEGLRVMAANSAKVFPDVLLRSFESGAWPTLHLVVEFGIPLLFLFRPALGVLLATLMHLPLTIIFAPSFAFTISSGWLCFFSPQDFRSWLVAARKHAKWIALAAASCTLLSRWLLFEGRWQQDPEWCIKEALFWCVLFTAWVALPTAGLLNVRSLSPPFRSLTLRGALFCAVFVANGLTPYLGVQFQHTAAMLSNLRIDDACYNSVLFPEALRLYDPYVRLERLEFAPHRSTPDASAAFIDRLWEPNALHRAREGWCRVHPEPLPAAGSYRGQRFEVPDLCAPGAWPLPEPWLPGFRRYQVNLTKGCNRRCLH